MVLVVEGRAGTRKLLGGHVQAHVLVPMNEYGSFPAGVDMYMIHSRIHVDAHPNMAKLRNIL